MGGVEFWFFAVVHVLILVTSMIGAYRVGFRSGKKFETKTMIELLDSLKVDCWEHTVFKDRFKAALQWTLDGKRKRDRNANPPPQA